MMKKLHIYRLYFLVAIFLITSCSSNDDSGKNTDIYNYNRESRGNNTVYLSKASYSDLREWSKDDHFAALKAFKKSCRAIRYHSSDQPLSKTARIGGATKHWFIACYAANRTPSNNASARKFWEKYFTPYKVLNDNKSDTGKITGYCKLMLNGSLKKTSRFRYPIYSVPKNIKQLAGSRYITRSAIYKGSLKGKGLEIAWTDDPGRLYYMHIQGSGLLVLPNGKKMSIHYARNNGFRFRSLTKVYRRYNVKKYTTIDLIRWLNTHRQFYEEVTSHDPSYTFFSLSREPETRGSQGVSLTPGRSIAADSRIFPYLMPMWIESYLPRTKFRPKHTLIRRLMINQDRGGAICGGPRCDVFCGSGDRMDHLSANLSSPSKHYVLFPKTLDVKSKYRY